MNLVSALLETAGKTPQKPALSFGNQIWSADRLFDSVLALASGLTARGVEPGQRVGICFPNGPAFAIAYLAVQACGGVAVPQGVLLRPREWMEQAANAGVKLQLTDERFGRLIAEPAAALGVRVFGPGDPERPFQDLAGPVRANPVQVESSAPAALLYTAAYEGFYRGAVLTHGSLLANARASADAWSVTPEDRIAAFLPLFHGFGAMTAMLTPLCAGAEAVLLERFTPNDAVQAIEARRPTIFPAVPTMIGQLLMEGRMTREVMGSVRNFTIGGAALPDALFHKVHETSGITLLQGYGLSENSPVVSVNRSETRNKVGSVGTALQSVEIAIEQDGRHVGPGVVGEVVLRGPSVMTGYHEDPAFTARTLIDGWLHTRDLGFLDEDGYLFLTGRLLRMAIVGGFNVYLAELERVLLTHPGIAGVQLEVQSDPMYGEQVLASIRARPGMILSADEVQSWCRRQISAYKIPRKLEVVPA